MNKIERNKTRICFVGLKLEYLLQDYNQDIFCKIKPRISYDICRIKPSISSIGLKQDIFCRIKIGYLLQDQKQDIFCRIKTRIYSAGLKQNIFCRIKPRVYSVGLKRIYSVGLKRIYKQVIFCKIWTSDIFCRMIQGTGHRDIFFLIIPPPHASKNIFRGGGLKIYITY